MDEIAALPEGYQALFARAREVLASDERVRGLWLGGSLARGTADAASDLDLIVAVADDAHAEFAASWREWLADITPTVLAGELAFAPGSFFSVTPGFERLDVVVEKAGSIADTFFRSRATVFDRDGLTARIPPPDPGPGPKGTVVGQLVTEFFRISIVETILVRDDWLLAREHLHALHGLIYRLFVEANAPLPPMGVKQWGTKLTPAQRAALRALPTRADSRVELGDAQVAAGALFVTNAEVLARALDVEWPHDLEQAAASHLRRQLGIEVAYPRLDHAVVGDR